MDLFQQDLGDVLYMRYGTILYICSCKIQNSFVHVQFITDYFNKMDNDNICNLIYYNNRSINDQGLSPLKL
jgi:hypothetical protein